jgi:hypothetical protein
MLLEPLRQPVALIHHRVLSPARSSREITAKAKRLCRSRRVSRSHIGHIPSSRFVKVVMDDVLSIGRGRVDRQGGGTTNLYVSGVTLGVSDLNRAKQFYGEVLG